MRSAVTSVWRATFVFLFALSVAMALPIASGAAWFYAQGWPPSWRAADWSSSGVAEATAALDDAVVQVYAARTGRWKSVFAVHTWVVLKQANSSELTRYEVVGWGRPLRRNAYPADGKWYGNVPEVVFELRGRQAQTLIPRIVEAIEEYPQGERGSYAVWPGPNSNTFVAWIGRQVPELELELPPTAIGKDYLGAGLAFASTPSGTGWQVSWSGIFGAAVGLREGFELHILGSTIGIDPEDLSLKLPSIGTVGPREIARAWTGIKEAFASAETPPGQ